MKQLRSGLTLVIGALLATTACQQMPPREEMLDTVCADHPCRPASRIELEDQSGQRHQLDIPAGPIFVAGWLSVVTGESHSLRLDPGKDGAVFPSWYAGAVPGPENFRIQLRQQSDDSGRYTVLRMHNPLDTPLLLHLEQLPVGEQRFFPLPVPPIPPGESVSKRLDHTIIELQVLGFGQVEPN